MVWKNGRYVVLVEVYQWRTSGYQVDGMVLVVLCTLLCGRILVGRLSVNVSLIGGIPLIPVQTLGTNRSITS